MWHALRKFGMAYCDLPTMLWNLTTLLRFVALDVDPRNDKPVGILSYAFLVAISACYYYVYFVSMIWFVFVRCRETGELFSAIIVFSLGASSGISMTKLWCLFSQRNNLRKLITAMLTCDAEVVPDSRFTDNMKPILRAAKKRALIVWNVIIWNGIIYIIIPLCMSERRFMEDVFEFFGFGDMATMKTSPNYEIAFTINIVGVFVSCYPSANISALFIIISGYVEAQMLALSKELSNVWEDALNNCHGYSFRVPSHLKDSNGAFVDVTRDLNCTYAALSRVGDPFKALGRIKGTSNTISDIDSIYTIPEPNMSQKDKEVAMNKYVRKRLEDILKSHSTNINLLFQVERVFQIAIAFEFMLLSMGLIAELLGGLEKTYIQLPFALISVSIDCLTGQRIKDASIAFENAVYDSKWENFDVTNRKIILLMIRSSQKTMTLSAGVVATLSLECLMVVLKTTYSAYTTLRSTMK